MIATVEDRFVRQQELVPRAPLFHSAPVVVGVGAIGRQVALQLAAIGVPQAKLIDFDEVEGHNVTTQGFRHQEVGQPKVLAVAEAMKQLDPGIRVQALQVRFSPAHLRQAQPVFCCVDSIETREVIWRAAQSDCPFWADGRMLGEVLRVLAVSDAKGAARYPETLFSEAEAEPGRCTSRSTIYAASIAAALMIHQFTRYLRGMPVVFDTMLNLLASEYMVSD